MKASKRDPGQHPDDSWDDAALAGILAGAAKRKERAAAKPRAVPVTKRVPKVSPRSPKA